MFGGGVAIGLSFLLIPLFGLHGSSIAICSGYFTMTVIRVYQTKDFFKVQFPFKTFMVLLIILIMVSLFNYGNQYFAIVNVFIAIVVLFYFNYEFVTMLVIKAKQIKYKYIK